MRLSIFVLFLGFLSAARALDTNPIPPAVGTPDATPPTATPAQAATPTAGPTDKAALARVVDALREANQMLSEGDNDGALAKVNPIIQTYPKLLAAYVLRGAIYTNKKMWDKAQSDFDTAHLLDPNNAIVNFNISEVKFVQKQYDAARPGFDALRSEKDSDISDLAAFKVFLCDLLGGHEDVAKKELDAFNQVGSNASYYYANAAWDLIHHQTEDARGWLASAGRIYAPQKNGFYSLSLTQLGYLPLPPPPAAP
jgi:Tfp pilus assembly protein PilF